MTVFALVLFESMVPGTHLLVITQDSKHPVCLGGFVLAAAGPVHLCTNAQVMWVHPRTPPHLRSQRNDGTRNHEKNQDPFIAAPTVSFVLPSCPAREVGCTTERSVPEELVPDLERAKRFARQAGETHGVREQVARRSLWKPLSVPRHGGEGR